MKGRNKKKRNAKNARSYQLKNQPHKQQANQPVIQPNSLPLKETRTKVAAQHGNEEEWLIQGKQTKQEFPNP